MRKLIIFLLWIILFLINNGCDSDKYLSSNLNQVAGLDSTSVSGFVRRFDNGEVVENALIKFAYQKTTTNSFGFYQINLVVTDDDQRNLAYPIAISAEKYISYYDVELVLPIPQEFNFNLLWRPPIVYKAAFLTNSGKYIVQALIRDYEGVANIDMVTCYMMKQELPDGPKKKYVFSIYFKFVVDSLTGFYQSDIERKLVIPDDRIAVPIIAADKYGFVDTLFHMVRAHRPDDPIYPVNWEEIYNWSFND